MVYNLNILYVEGTVCSMTSNNINMLLIFLDQNDHEGACISMTTYEGPGEMDFITYFDPEIIYNMLQKALNAL